MTNPVNHPPHYTAHPSGVECIQITEHMGFCLGNAIKYIWRADLKGDAIEDLRKARWYLDREIARREAAAGARKPAERETMPETTKVLWGFEDGQVLEIFARLMPGLPPDQRWQADAEIDGAMHLVRRATMEEAVEAMVAMVGEEWP